MGDVDWEEGDARASVTEREQYDAMVRRLFESTITRNPYCNAKPTPRQLLFLEQTGLECLFGGAAGGGKSSALLMSALQFAQMPNYSALLLRRSFADLEKPDSLIPRSHEMLASTDAAYYAARRVWKFPSGATLSFGYLDTDSDVYQYQSAAFQFIGFDELTQFTEFQYRYLFSRLRVHTGINVPLRMRSATNPGGVGHAWVKERFGLGASASGHPDRVFIPSNLTDNPHLDETRYRKSLAELDQVTRRQLEFGDWDAMAEGLIFKREWFRVVDDVPSDLRKVRYWDLAATPKKRKGHDPDYTSGTLLGRAKNGVYFVLDVKRTRSTPLDVERLLLATATEDGRDVPVWIEQEPGASGVHVVDHIRRNVLDGFELRSKRPDQNKTARAKPLSAAAEAGNVLVKRGAWNAEWFREIEAFPLGEHDDSVDSTTGAHQSLSMSRAPAMSLL